MKRTGFVVALIGLVVGLVPTIFYAAANFGEFYTEDWYEGASKFVTVLDVLSGIVVVIGFIVIVSTLPKSAPTGGPMPAAGFPPPQFAPPGYPPQGSPGGFHPHQPAHGQPSYAPPGQQQGQTSPEDGTKPPDLTK